MTGTVDAARPQRAPTTAALPARMASDPITGRVPYGWEHVPPLPGDAFHRFVIMSDNRLYACLNVYNRHVTFDVARTVAQDFCDAINRRQALR